MPTAHSSETFTLLDQRPLLSASERFKQLLVRVDIVSFDIFDTLIVRRVPEPKAIFEIMEREWVLPGFAEERIRAEAAARKHAWDSQRRVEITLAEIYSMAKIATHLQKLLMAAETEIELAYCRRNEAAWRLFQGAMKQSKRIFLTSDMYLPIDIVERILSANGIEGYERLYLSSDRMTTKASGGLFDSVLAEAGVEAHRVLHVGDNAISDIKVAKEKGLNAILFPKISDLQVYDSERARAMGPVSLDTKLRRIVWHGYAQAVADGAPGEGKDGFWYSVGFRLLAPGLIGFAKMIREGLERHSLERVFFLARDGAIVMEAFKALYPELSDVCRYLVVSRRILNIAALQTLGDQELNFLVSGTTRKSCKEFLERVGLAVDDIPLEVLSRNGLDLDRVIVSGEDYRQLRDLFLSLRESIFEIAAREREALTLYLNQMGWGERTRVGIVDVGWHATLQRAFDIMIAKGEISSVLVKGFYFGTYEAASRAVPTWSNRLESFMFHYGEPKWCEQAIRSCVEFHELLFSDVSFSATGIGIQDGQIVFRYASSAAEEVQFEIVHSLRRGARDAIRYLGPDLVGNSIELTALRDYYAGYSAEILNSPMMMELLNIGDVMHAEGFEHQAYSPLIVAPSARGRRAYRSAKKRSYWKQGYKKLHRRSLLDVF